MMRCEEEVVSAIGGAGEAEEEDRCVDAVLVHVYEWKKMENPDEKET